MISFNFQEHILTSVPHLYPKQLLIKLWKGHRCAVDLETQSQNFYLLSPEFIFLAVLLSRL